MKDIRWRDFLLALVLSPVLVLPVVAVVYVVLFGLLGLDSGTYSYWLVVTMMVTCTAEGFILIRLYRGVDDVIEHGWAWLVVIAAIPAVVLVLYATDILSAELAWYLVAELYANVAAAFLLVVLTIFLNARSTEARSPERPRADVERDRGLWLLRR